MLTSLLMLILTVCLIAASGFYSGSEMGLYCLSRLRIRLLAERGSSPNASVLLRLANRQQETVLAVLLGTNLANYLATVVFALLLTSTAQVERASVEFYSAAILAPVIFVLGDVVPKNWFQVQADRLMYQCARILQATVFLFRFTGVLWLLRATTWLGARLAGHQEEDDWAGPRGEVYGLLREGGAGGALTQEQTRIIERVMNLSSVRVGSIMIPRRHVVSLPVDAGRTAFEQSVRSHHYSRMPILGRDRKTVVGIVGVFDVLADQNGGPIEAWLRPPLTISASESATRALVQLQRARQTMAVVTDPRRGFVGIVTLKDVVEEIFGELPAW